MNFFTKIRPLKHPDKKFAYIDENKRIYAYIPLTFISIFHIIHINCMV